MTRKPPPPYPEGPLFEMAAGEVSKNFSRIKAFSVGAMLAVFSHAM